ncbi:hypothetical protein [Streptomyces erythrochromogenes]|uniref:hypothetical protein n=1 Tax=Streptomyces erythrochromogenes TaxID=285574 RepID=UPI0036FAF930
MTSAARVGAGAEVGVCGVPSGAPAVTAAGGGGVAAASGGGGVAGGGGVGGVVGREAGDVGAEEADQQPVRLAARGVRRVRLVDVINFLNTDLPRHTRNLHDDVAMLAIAPHGAL